MEKCKEQLYPNIDMNVWTRSCEQDITSPVQGKITAISSRQPVAGNVDKTVCAGTIPSWLRGSLLRNGPGSTGVGPDKFKHLFDCSALIHKFAIGNGCVTYQCRFLQSNTYRRNKAASRIVVDEFGTKAVPDPCHTIFDRWSSLFSGDLMTDNAVVSIYPIGDEVYALSEVPYIHRIDPATLETLERKDLMNCSVVCHTSHPHVMDNGDVYNVGISTVKGRMRHIVVKFSNDGKGDMFEKADIVGSMAPRWLLHPSYMHSFGITENYFVIVEQPLVVSLGHLVVTKVTNKVLSSCLKWYPEYETHIVLISRSTGKEVKRFTTETMFFVHVINCYEKGDFLNVDICAYKDASIIDGMYLEALNNLQSNPDCAEWFRSRPKRLELPLTAENLTRVEAYQLTDVGCELPRINYRMSNGRPYRYFYAISSDIDTDHPSSLIKVDIKSRETLSWGIDKSFASEPVFIPAPDAIEEDDGVILSSVLWSEEANHVTLVILDARTMLELARADFDTPSPVPRDFHGWFLSEVLSTHF